jgi:hypothetical protein
MRGNRLALATIVIGGCVAVGGLTPGCSGGQERASPSSATSVPPPPSETTTTTTAQPTSDATRSPAGKIPKTFDRKNFDRSLTDVNEWVPLVPGLQSVSKGTVYVGDRLLPHIRVTTTTDVTKEIDGVPAVLVLDQDFDAGQLSEQSIDFLAEDEGGNVWYMGSYTEVYEGGQFLNSEDAWLAGVNGAVPGLWMPGAPKAGTPAFYQVQIPGGEQSSAQVVDVGRKTCVPFKCYTDVVVIEEAGSENKYWASGVGQILTEPLSGASQEVEELVNLRQLSSKALAELSREVLKLDRGAAVRVATVFGGSEPAERL